MGPNWGPTKRHKSIKSEPNFIKRGPGRCYWLSGPSLRCPKGALGPFWTDFGIFWGKTFMFDLGVAPKIHSNYPEVNKLRLN